MSQVTTGTGTGSTLAKIVETLSSTWLASEQLKTGMPLGYVNTANSPSDYQHVQTGTNHDGSTLVDSQWISGVSNRHVLAGAAVLASIGIVTYALTR